MIFWEVHSNYRPIHEGRQQSQNYQTHFFLLLVTEDFGAVADLETAGGFRVVGVFRAGADDLELEA